MARKVHAPWPPTAREYFRTYLKPYERVWASARSLDGSE